MVSAALVSDSVTDPDAHSRLHSRPPRQRLPSSLIIERAAAPASEHARPSRAASLPFNASDYSGVMTYRWRRLALTEREIINRLGHRRRSVLDRVVTQSTKAGVELLLIQAGEHRVRACRYPGRVVWPARRYLLNDLAADGAAEARRPEDRANLRGGRKAIRGEGHQVTCDMPSG